MGTRFIQPQAVQREVDRFTGAYLDEQVHAAHQLHANYGRLWEVIRQVYQAGGKHYRPYALMLTYEALGGKDHDKIIPIAAMTELLHVSLLAIDDIIDRDYTRHGQPNITGTYLQLYADAVGDEATRLHYATSAALLAENLLLSSAYDVIAAADLPETQRRSIQQLLHQALFTAAGGELLDVEATFTPSADTQLWLTIARTKTAYYSFVLPLRLGGLLAHATPDVQTMLVALGEAMGIAFQLSDDLLDIFAHEAESGKPRFRDIREGKPTYVLTQALDLATPSDRRWLSGMLYTPTITSAQGKRIQTIVEQSGARRRTEEQLTGYVAQAEQELARLKLPAEADQAFRQLIDKTAWRKA
jgi:geranylgeranyl diphosphate synthase, type II